MSPQQTYTDEEILEMLRRCADSYDICSPRRFADMEDTCSPSLVMRRFGGWTDAKKEAGIEIANEPTGGRKRQYSNEDVLHHIRECARRNDGHCTVELLQDEDDLIAPSVAIERFGSWLEAKEMAGLDIDERSLNHRPREFSDEDYFELLRECKEKHGKVTQKKFNEEAKKHENHPTAGAVRKRFQTEDQGGWNRAKRKAGLDESTTRTYDDEELLEMLRRCKEKHGSCSSSTFAADDEFCSPETVQRRFETWNDAKDEAGV